MASRKLVVCGVIVVLVTTLLIVVIGARPEQYNVTFQGRFEFQEPPFTHGRSSLIVIPDIRQQEIMRGYGIDPRIPVPLTGKVGELEALRLKVRSLTHEQLETLIAASRANEAHDSNPERGMALIDRHSFSADVVLEGVLTVKSDLGFLIDNLNYWVRGFHTYTFSYVPPPEKVVFHVIEIRSVGPVFLGSVPIE